MSGQVARGKRNKVRRPVDNFQSMLLPNGKSSLKEHKIEIFSTPQTLHPSNILSYTDDNSKNLHLWKRRENEHGSSERSDGRGVWSGNYRTTEDAMPGEHPISVCANIGRSPLAMAARRHWSASCVGFLPGASRRQQKF